MPFETLLVPIDFSSHSEKALDYAINLANASGGQIHLLHAYQLPIQVPTPDCVITGDYWKSLRDRAERKLFRTLHKVEAAGVEAETHLVETPPVQAIVETAEKIGADLIVMGTHGRTGLKHVLLGSVAERTIRTAPCPVLTLKDSTHQNGQGTRRGGSFEFAKAASHDLSLVVRGPTLEETFREASEALLAATVESPDSVGTGVTRKLRLVADTMELLLTRFLNELIDLRETRHLLFRARHVQLHLGDLLELDSNLAGDVLNPDRYRIARDVKAAVTCSLQAARGEGGWEAFVRLNV